ncbi:MAG: response regulator transcription factor [Bacteroidales bacterium]|nr:response regulator transcription factor [Bacteroidales bacterium]
MNAHAKIVLVEDEPYNLRLLQGMIEKLRPEWEVVKTLESVKESVEWLRANPHPDLFFMDIQLADGLCFSIFDQVEVHGMVIFTTAFDNYAIRAFKVNSIDYLLKPFKEKDLEAALEKFENLRNHSIAAESNRDYAEILDAIRKGEKKFRKRFLISKAAAFYMLPVEEIAYLLSENRITTAVTFSNQNHVVDFPLETLEEQLNPENFFRANRQLIVNINAIEKIENYFSGKLKIRLNPPFDGEPIISRLKATDFKEWVGR